MTPNEIKLIGLSLKKHIITTKNKIYSFDSKIEKLETRLDSIQKQINILLEVK